MAGTSSRRWAFLVVIGLFAGLAALPLAAQPQRPPRGPAAPATPPPADDQVQFRGQVIDAETGKPVEQFTLEWGWAGNAKDPAAIGWGGMSERADKRPNGTFSTSTGWQKGKKIGLRVVAEGYVPEMITPQLVTSPAKMENLVVKLKRGATLRGTVLNHAGTPVAGAEIFVAGAQPVELREDEMFGPRVKSKYVTDQDGHFAISGGGAKDQQLIISAPPPGLFAWVVTIADPTKETTINLPEPAALAIRYDIPGAPEQGQFRLELKTWEMPQWKGVVGVQRQLKPTNGQTLTDSSLTPGVYDLARTKNLRMGDAGHGYMLDRRTITLEAGKPVEAAFARDKGAPVSGTVEGLAEAKLPGAFVQVRSGEATGDREAANEWKLATFDAVTCGPDGAFTTETLMPGTYNIVVEAYGPESPEMRRNTGIRLPDYVGVARVTVPETGQPPKVKVQLKPRS